MHSSTATTLRRLSGVFAAVLAAILIALGVFGGATAASAHGGPFQLSVVPDGAGGVTVTAVYAEDGHPVSEIIDPVATAVAPDGSTVGPVALISSSEGEGIWVSSAPFLPVGQWAVTVSTTVPEAVSTTVDVTVAELAPPVQPGETIAPVAEREAAAVAPTASGGVSPLTVALWIAAGVVALVVMAAVVWRLRGRGARQERR